MTVSEVQVDGIPAGAFLLDVREPDEWRAGHVAEAVHIPLGELQARADEVPVGRTLYVICRSGGRSYHAAEWLGRTGRQAVNVAGGMRAWAAAGRQMISETGEPPLVA